NYELRISPNLTHRDSCSTEIDVLFPRSGSHPTLCCVAPLVLARTHNCELIMTRTSVRLYEKAGSPDVLARPHNYEL
ncbi:MAG: hypothetical protein J5614_00325, partial [Paludibacteraceae bacterium]|nr:hypothetical protein [Paludibacteraceae bacterium]